MSAGTCVMLFCFGEEVATLRYKPPGYAYHEGHHLYGVCAEHRDKLAGESGYAVVRWDSTALRFVEVES